MPYCTIEEAWSKSIDPSILDIDNAETHNLNIKIYIS